jgi:hypothetical protein
MQDNLKNQDGSSHNFGSVGLFVALLSIAFFAIIASILFAIARGFQDASTAKIIIGMAAIGMIIFIIANIYSLVLLYRVWKFIINQSHHHNLKPSIKTPGKAVGYLFIPIFNFYWMFQAFGELPKDLNLIAKAKNNTDSISEKLGIAIASMNLMGMIPILGIIPAFIGCFILIPIFMNQSINLCKSLSDVTSAQVSGS